MDSESARKVQALVEPVLAEMGYELVDLQLRNELVGLVMRLIIYKEEGITIADCSAVSREVSHLLEVEDPIVRSYHLEVSSPGLDRPLVSRRDFDRNKGKKVKIKFHAGEQVETVIGTVAGTTTAMVELTIAEESEESKQILLEKVVKAKLVIEF